MRAALRELFAEVLPRLDAERAVREQVRVEAGRLRLPGHGIDLPLPPGAVRVVAIGKAAVAMARGLSAVLPQPMRGVAVAPAPSDRPLPGLRVVVGSHPVPDRHSAEAAAAVLAELDGCGAGDLVCFLLSGGGSALCEAPLDPRVPIADLASAHRSLVRAGLDIVQMNAVRRQLSAVKGGRLAARAAAAHQLTLLVSDVPPSHPEAVASGPSLPSASTLADCRRIVAAHDLRLPASVQRALADAVEPPAVPTHGACAVLLDSAEAARLAARAASARGWQCAVMPEPTVEREIEAEAAALLDHLDSLGREHPGATVAVIAAGEVACPIPVDVEPGVGGRNQQLALALARRIAGRSIAALSAGTDGIDGSSPAAGAVVDGTTVARAAAAGRDVAAAMARFDAHPLLEALGDAVVTGPTGTNVRDLRVVVGGAPTAD